MGEVYRARDTTLNRDVALKVRPAVAPLDADRFARVKREAQIVAALNHPNIAAIYGLEDSDIVQALVLELDSKGFDAAGAYRQRSASDRRGVVNRRVRSRKDWKPLTTAASFTAI